MSAKAPAKGHAAKHVHHRKHQAHHKKHHPVKQKQAAAKAPAHNVHTVAHHPKPAKPRGYAVGDLLPVCAFEAVAMSLRLAGQQVTDDDVAGLWEACGSRELSIEEALEEAAELGGAECRPSFRELDRSVFGHWRHEPDDAGFQYASQPEELFGQYPALSSLDVAHRLGNPDLVSQFAHLLGKRLLVDAGPAACSTDIGGYDIAIGLHAPNSCMILGIDVPGPHCVLATADGWWSWGDLHDPWPARIEEAWAVSWT